MKIGQGPARNTGAGNTTNYSILSSSAFSLAGVEYLDQSTVDTVDTADAELEEW